MAQGQIWIRDGVVHVSDPTDGEMPAMLMPGEGLQVSLNGRIIDGPTEVYAGDEIAVTAVETVIPGHCRVVVDGDGLEARVDIKPDSQVTHRLLDCKPTAELRLVGDPVTTPHYTLTVSELVQLLAEQGVTAGLLEDEIRRVFSQPQGGLFVVARGRSPKPPVDERVEILFREGEKGKPLVRADDSVDYYELQSFPSIKEGERMAVKHPAVPGDDGFKVTGEVLRAAEPKAMILQSGSGTQLTDEGCVVAAAISGRPSWSRRGNVFRFEVNRVLEHSGDISLETGNIRFVGDVKVTGSVLEQMTVQAEGSIEIMGNVTEATIQAKGDVLVHGNVFSSSIRAGGEGAHLGKFLEKLNDLSEQLTSALMVTRQLLAAGQKDKAQRLEPGRAFLLVMDRKFPRIPVLVKDLRRLEREARSTKISLPDSLTEIIGELGTTFLNIRIAAVEEVRSFVVLLTRLQSVITEVGVLVGTRCAVTVASAASSILEATGDIVVSSQGSWNSTLHAGGDIRVVGVLRGGLLQAKGDVFLSKVGSQRGMCKCEISLAAGGKLQIDAAYPVITVRIGNRGTVIEKPLRNVKASLDEKEGLIDLVGLSL